MLTFNPIKNKNGLTGEANLQKIIYRHLSKEGIK